MCAERLNFLTHLHPYDNLPDAVRTDIVDKATWIDAKAGDQIYDFGQKLDGLYVIASGQITVRDGNDAQVSLLQDGNSFGERGLMKDGIAVTSAKAVEPSRLMRIAPDMFHALRREHEPFRRFFDRRRASTQNDVSPFDLTRVRVETLMAKTPQTCTPGTTIVAAARKMHEKRISCLCVTDNDTLVGIVTVRDLTGRALAAELPYDTPVSEIMTPSPRTLPPTAIGSDVLHMMVEYRLGHLPIVSAGALVGIVTQTDLTRAQASNAASFVADAARAKSAPELASITSRIPQLLVQLVAAGNRHDVVTRMITDIADVVTRRLLRIAEDTLGPPPCAYVWLACGSQGRQEQTGVSDQDNCIIYADDATPDAPRYFAELAESVSDGLHACGYVYCPGDMMATNPKWCQPLSVWRDYFKGWIKSPSKEAQMLASVMFDLRVIGGDETLFDGLQADTLKAAAANSIFTAHMASNALTHQTPLGLLKGLATIRSGEHRNTIDMKHNGVVPMVDLGRMYALQGQLTEVNTRARVEAAIAAETVSESGGSDLLDAYDLVAQSRLEHQATRIKNGKAPDNFLPPNTLSGFERSHLRDAFVVIKTMQSALMQGRGAMG